MEPENWEKPIRFDPWYNYYGKNVYSQYEFRLNSIQKITRSSLILKSFQEAIQPSVPA